jgi:magnesium-transporting ATPase (P-type)
LVRLLEKRDWYAEDIDAVIEHLESDKGGLSEEEASRRLGVYGQNELKEEKKTTALEQRPSSSSSASSRVFSSSS